MEARNSPRASAGALLCIRRRYLPDWLAQQRLLASAPAMILLGVEALSRAPKSVGYRVGGLFVLWVEQPLFEG